MLSYHSTTIIQMTHASPFFRFWIIAKYKSSLFGYPNITISSTAFAFSLLDCFCSFYFNFLLPFAMNKTKGFVCVLNIISLQSNGCEARKTEAHPRDYK